VTTGIAILGNGFIASLHVQAALTLSDVAVVGVAGRDPARVDTFARRWQIPRSTVEWPTLCTEPDVDLVVVGTPNALHHEQVIHAVDNGKHVLVEKPMATTVAAATEMIECAGQAGVVLAVGHMWRFHDEVVAMRRRISDGEFGRVIRTHGWGVHAGWGPSGWFTEARLAGGGALIDMGIHAIDTARFLLGDPRPARVQASIGYGEFGDYAVDDDGLILVDWDNGTRSLVEFGWWQPRLNGLEADTEVFGTSGTGRIWTMPLPPPENYVHCAVPMYATQLADVVQAIRDGARPTCGGDVGLLALDIVERAYATASHAAG
jgi:predicted dehydrogenase